MKSLLSVALVLALSAPALAQTTSDQKVKPEFDLDPDASFEVPEAPEVVPPGWPPPDNVCGDNRDYDLTDDPFNPGLYTEDQYRSWSITDYNRDNPAHNYFLALMYDYGKGVGQNRRRASELYRKAADAGITQAAARLGDYYCSRELYCSAARAYYSAAQADNGAAQMKLSRLYRWGLGVYYDPIEAYKWGYLGMEKTEGNWIVHNMEGVNYLRDILDNLPSADEVEAEERIERWRKGFDMTPLRCQVD